MRKSTWIALAAVGLMHAAGGAVWASDTVRLGGPQAQTEITGGTNTELVRGFHGGHYGYRGGYYGGGYRGGYYGGSYYRGGYGGYYGGYGARYYSPYFSIGYYSRPYYGSYYYPRSSYYYYSPSYYSTPYYSSYYYPCAGDSAPTVALQATSNSNLLPAPQIYTPAPTTPAPARAVPPMPPAFDGSFRYDGEPRSIVPMPVPTNADPVKGPQAIVPLDGKFVSFGGVSPIPTPRPRNIVGSTANTTTVRVAYPAYGEEPIAPVRRK